MSSNQAPSDKAKRRKQHDEEKEEDVRIGDDSGIRSLAPSNCSSYLPYRVLIVTITVFISCSRRQRLHCPLAFSKQRP